MQIRRFQCKWSTPPERKWVNVSLFRRRISGCLLSTHKSGWSKVVIPWCWPAAYVWGKHEGWWQWKTALRHHSGSWCNMPRKLSLFSHKCLQDLRLWMQDAVFLRHWKVGSYCFVSQVFVSIGGPEGNYKNRFPQPHFPATSFLPYFCLVGAASAQVMP